MKNILKISLKFVFAVFLLSGLNAPHFAQTAGGDAQSKKTKWQGLSGKNDEFYFLMPENFQAAADGNYFMVTANGRKAQIDSHRTLARYINGVVLIMEFYEGDANIIRESLTAWQKGEIVKDETLENFQFKSYVEKTPEFVKETQYFLVKNRLYVLQAVARSENNQIIGDFFDSVRLVNQKQAVAPNLNGVASDSVSALPEIVESEPERLDDSQLLKDKPDRDVIILYKPRPKFSAEARRAKVSGSVKLRLLFSSSGKISKVEVVSSPARELTDGAVKAAQQIQFLPAEKDGKLVSTFKVVDYSFSTY